MSKEQLYEKIEDYKNASSRLNESTKIEIFNDIVYDGVIQRFELTFKLGWRLMKLYLEDIGIAELRSPRATIRKAYIYGLIDDGEEWIDMMIDHNKTSRFCDEEEVRLIYDKIIRHYNDPMLQLGKIMEEEINRVY